MAQLTFTALPLSATVAPADALQIAVPEAPVVDEYEGLTLDQRAHIGMHSGFLNVTMHTAEQVLRHCQLHDEQRKQDAATGDALKEDTASKRATVLAKRVEHDALVEAARAEWRTAVEARKRAIIGWDDYVKQAHDRFTALRTSKPIA